MNNAADNTYVFFHRAGYGGGAIRALDYYERVNDDAERELAKRQRDETLTDTMRELILERTQLVRSDADDLAWDLLRLVRTELEEARKI